MPQLAICFKGSYMNIQIIDECTRLSLANEITFPQQLMKLAANNIERYSVDLVALTKSAYDTNNEWYVSNLAIDVEPVAEHFDAEALKNAIAAAQQQKINYRTFLDQAIAAGCCWYEVFITGKKVIYAGRNGDQHVELFPSAK